MSWKTVRDLYPETARCRFLAQLRSGKRVFEAAHSAGIPVSSAYRLREVDTHFAEEWHAAAVIGKLRRRPAWTEVFLDLLAMGKLVKEAASELQRSLSLLYAWRQRDAAFARRWRYARAKGWARIETWRQPLLEALAEGLSNTAACRRVGISISQATRARRQDARFRRAWAKARRSGHSS